MKQYKDFLDHDFKIKTTYNLFPDCSQNELFILQFMLKELLKGKHSFNVLNIIEELFKEQDIHAIKYLDNIKSLLNLEYIKTNDIEIRQPSLLGLISLDISLNARFMHILENNKNTFRLPEITPYQNNVDYLKDEFLKINALNQKHKESAKKRLKDIETCIKKRLSITKKRPQVLKFLDKFNLNENEKIIFFAICQRNLDYKKECDAEKLLNLISKDEYSKMANLHLLDDEGALIKNGLIDYTSVFFDTEVSERSFYIPSNIYQLIISNKENTKTPLNEITAFKEQDMFELIKPKEKIEDAVLPKETKELIETLIQHLNKNVLNLLKKWGIKDKNKGMDAKIIFHGLPGTGKTMSAKIIANALKKPMLSLDCSKILGMYVGESEKNVRKIFDLYQEIKEEIKEDPILLLDEADQFLGSRSKGDQSSAGKMYNQMQNIFLSQIEKFDGILIATTNLLENIDLAFSRRFNYKIKFPKPNFQERILIWKLHLPKHAEFKDLNIEELAKYDLSGGQIKLIIKNTAFTVATRTDIIFSGQDFITEINREINSSFDREKRMGFLQAN